jgi:SAM-dependent methyltransferase
MDTSASAGAPAAFDVGDLGVFDAARLRELIQDVPGAVPPDLAARALTTATAYERDALEPLAARVARTLPPAARERFVRARRGPVDPAAREAARRAVLDRLFWELTYWKIPEEYERLIAGEPIHPGTFAFARPDDAVVLDAGAGTGRATLPLARHARLVYAMDPARPLLRLLEDKVRRAGLRNVEPLRGTFARIPLPDASVDVVVSCSAFGPPEARGGERGLAELRRVTRPGGRVVVIWPEDPAWFARHGFRYAVLPGHLRISFPTLEDGVAAARRFYGPTAVRHLERTGRPELPFSVLGVKEPRDLCWLTVRE